VHSDSLGPSRLAVQSVSAGREHGARLTGVDLLRAVAILHVIAVHINNGYVRTLSLVPGVIVTHWNDGVTLFFVISGFLIMRSIMVRERDIHRLSLRAFYARRVARIFPLMFGSIALGAAMLALGFDGQPFKAQPHEPFDAVFWSSLLTFSFNWVRVAATQHGAGQWGLHWDVMWSLAVEEQFYLLLPAVLILVRTRARFVGILVAVIAFCAISRWIGPHYYIVWNLTSFACFDALGVGVLAALVAPSLDPRMSGWLVSLGLVVLAAGAMSSDDSLRPLVIITGAAAYILGVQAKGHSFGRGWRLPARIGELSYEMYLLHPLVLAALAPVFLAWSLSFGSALLMAVCATVAVAYAVDACFTKPMNRWLRRYLLAPAAVPAGET
jgi:peptidoglycan/LPS O-acetylase OafA/YrhL